jgi:hypothetical protein
VVRGECEEWGEWVVRWSCRERCELHSLECEVLR